VWNDVKVTMEAPLPSESRTGMGASPTGAIYFDMIVSHQLGYAVIIKVVI
jgi:hypothetical protein